MASHIKLITNLRGRHRKFPRPRKNVTRGPMRTTGQQRRRGHGPRRLPAAGTLRPDGAHRHRRTRRPRPAKPRTTAAGRRPRSPSRTAAHDSDGRRVSTCRPDPHLQ
ncbi:hypothetical protein E1286_02440 [Nonomuraea terrae]|uniref:Uncharacterized protein n=1 Tax=Nonomuraea terrae TaxID=2530383 RepID=A0A4R4ZFW6_9ACTN|nr:hypothetical protein E1286_02440 [Nonomuraea terrae]